MPLFGVDDVLFLLVSTSFFFWAQRKEHSRGSDEAGEDNHLSKEELKKTEYLRRTYSTTPLLLPGFNLSEPNACGLSGGAPSFIQQSRLGALAPEYNPSVPHRQYNVHKQVAQVGTLTTCSESQVAEFLLKFTPSQVASLFRDMETEGLWESVLRVSKGISTAGQTLKYLPQSSIERSIKTMLNAHKNDEAVKFFFEYAKDVFISDDLLVLLCDGCRGSKESSLNLYRHLLPFKSRWNEVTYACCLTITAEYHPAEAIELYRSYCAFQEMESKKGERAFFRLLSSSTLLQESGVVRNRPVSKLCYLYHIIVPLVAEHYPESLPHYIADMMLHEEEVAPDVFLKCILCSSGRALVEPYAKEYLKQKNPELDVDGLASAQLAIELYSLQPSAMNINSLLNVFIYLEQQQELTLSSSSSLVPKPLLPIASILEEAPLDETHARILSRTITERKASWPLTSVFVNSMLHRQHYFVIPTLSRHLSRMGRWSAAATAMSVYMSNRRSRLSVAEVGLCVESCVKSGRWNSALFWVDRASAAGLKLSPQVYDTALGTSAHIPWENTARLIHSIRRAGGMWSDSGYLRLVETCAAQGNVKRLASLVTSSEDTRIRRGNCRGTLK